MIQAQDDDRAFMQAKDVVFLDDSAMGSAEHVQIMLAAHSAIGLLAVDAEFAKLSHF